MIKKGRGRPKLTDEEKREKRIAIKYYKIKIIIKHIYNEKK